MNLKTLFVLLISVALLFGCGGGPGESPAPQPTVAISAAPEIIGAGQQTTITWVSTGATRVEISGIPDASSPSGALVVSPATTTTYTITAYGGSQASIAAVTVTVIPIALPPIPPPPPPLVYSVSITVTWDLPATYGDGTPIALSDQALIVVTVFMKTDTSTFLDTDLPLATSAPGATSVTFGPIDVTQWVTYYVSAKASVNGLTSTFASPVTHVWN